MNKIISKLALAASLSFAMAFMASCVGDDSSAFVGKWIYEDGSGSLELFKDGTGIESEKGTKNDAPIAISWKIVENRRFVMTAQGFPISQAYDYEVSDRILTLIDDKGKRDRYFKPQEGKIEGKTLTDNRDGKKYKTVIMGAQTWMAENLNYEAKESKCYDNKPENCSKYGRLYSWYEAVDFCPYGWHMPSKEEWGKLTGLVGNDAGTKLKAKSGWSGNGNGTDNYGFSALPGGWRNHDGSFFEVDSNGSWWSATEYNSDNASSHNVLYNGSVMGEYSSSKFNLCSVRCIQDKVKPIGNYKGGKEHGEWKFFYENGNLKTVGNFKDGEEHGEWKIFYENGNLKAVGNFKDGKEQGEWKEFYENGNVKEVGNYINGKVHGEAKYFHENGNLKSVGNYIDGKLQGEWKDFHENGNLESVGNFKDDKQQGEWKYFRKNGNLESVGNLKDGKLQGEWKDFHENGNLESVRNYIDDKVHGEWKFFYENGNLKSVRNFKDGKEHGEAKYFHENGNLKGVGNFKDGNRQGEWKYFNKNGNLETVENFKDGKLHGEMKNFHENGNLKSVRNFKDGVEQR